jgi:hypothetical protein
MADSESGGILSWILFFDPGGINYIQLNHASLIKALNLTWNDRLMLYVDIYGVSFGKTYNTCSKGSTLPEPFPFASVKGGEVIPTVGASYMGCQHRPLQGDASQSRNLSMTQVTSRIGQPAGFTRTFIKD